MEIGKYALSGLIGGLLEVPFYLKDLEVFSEISFRITGVHSVVVGVILHLIASVIIGVVALSLLNVAGIEGRGFWASLLIGIMLGSSVLSLFSLPVHLTVFPLKITLVYVISHIFYGVFVYLAYWVLQRG